MVELLGLRFWLLLGYLRRYNMGKTPLIAGHLQWTTGNCANVDDIGISLCLGLSSRQLFYSSFIVYPNRTFVQDHRGMVDEKCESRLYIGNIDQRITEANVLKMFSPFGEIVAEDFLWHTRGPKRGEPRGYAFIQYNSKEEAQLAKAKMHGRLTFGRPLIVRFASEKCPVDATNPRQTACDSKNPSSTCSASGQVNRNAKIAAIKNKLKSLEEGSCSVKKSRLDN